MLFGLDCIGWAGNIWELLEIIRNILNLGSIVRFGLLCIGMLAIFWEMLEVLGSVGIFENLGWLVQMIRGIVDFLEILTNPELCKDLGKSSKSEKMSNRPKIKDLRNIDKSGNSVVIVPGQPPKPEDYWGLGEPQSWQKQEPIGPFRSNGSWPGLGQLA